MPTCPAEDGKLQPRLPALLQLRFQMRVQGSHSDVLSGNLESKSRQRPSFSAAALSSASKVQEALGSSTMVLTKVPACRCQCYGCKEAGLGYPPVCRCRSNQPLKHGSPHVVLEKFLPCCRRGSSFLDGLALQCGFGTLILKPPPRELCLQNSSSFRPVHSLQ